MHHLLVDEVREEASRRDAHGFVVALERATELQDDALEHQLAELGELSVDDRDERGEHRGEVRGRHLGLHHRAGEEASAPDHVLREDLREDVLDVGRVHLVHQTVDGLLQRVPCHALVLRSRLVRLLRHHLRELEGRDIGPARASRGERFPLDRLLGRPISRVLASTGANIVAEVPPPTPPAIAAPGRRSAPPASADFPRSLSPICPFAAARPFTRIPTRTATVGRPRIVLVAFIATRPLATPVAVRGGRAR